MATKILFAPRQSQEVLDIVRSLTPHGFELVVADFGTPEFYQVAADAEYFMDVLAVISNCPQTRNPCNGFNPTSIRVIVRERALAAESWPSEKEDPR